MGNVELKLFSIAELRQWLLHNINIEGLTKEVITPARAYAILNNPYVQDEDHVVSTIYEDGNLAAYTAAFPDMYKEKRIWWFSTLYCKPEFEGKGYGLIVVGSLAERYGDGNFFDMEGAPETVEIFKHLGLKTSYVPQYELGPGKINRGSLKGELAYVVQNLKLKLHSEKERLRKEASNARYSIEYSSFVDDEAYSFIVENNKNDVFIREQKMLNWILVYPFLQNSPLINRVEDECVFSSKVLSVNMLAVKVRIYDELVGFYIMKLTNDGVFVKFLYYQEKHSNIVFLSIAEHLLKYENPKFITRNKDLTTFIKRYKLTSKCHQQNVSFSYPSDFELKENFALQSGDGDNFV